MARGAIYNGVIYTQSTVKSICPWCIATGAVSEKIDAGFIDYDFVDDNDQHMELPAIYRQKMITISQSLSKLPCPSRGVC